MIGYLIVVVASAIASVHVSAGNGWILDGTKAPIETFPHMASIRSSGRHICGGALISKKHVLTSADCLRIAAPSTPLEVQLGSSNRLQNGSVCKVIKVDVSPYYNASNRDCDVAVATLAFPIDFSVVIKKIDVASNTDAAKRGDVMVVTGWGLKTESDTEFSEWLQKAEMPYTDLTNCRYLYKYNKLVVTDNMFCAGTGNWGGGPAIHKGDFGNPIIKNGLLVGIASWGLPNAPSVFTNVASPKVRNFIDSILKN